jgi:hypothetical protein
MFLNTLYTTTLKGDSLRGAWKIMIHVKLREFIRRFTAGYGPDGQPIDFASKGFMHTAILMFQVIASEYLCEPFNFYITLLYSVIFEMVSDVTCTFSRRLILKHFFFVMQRWYCSSPFSLTDAEWERVTLMRMALAMSTHPRLGEDCLLNDLDPSLLPHIAVHWQHLRFPMYRTVDFVTNYDSLAPRWDKIWVETFSVEMMTRFSLI